MDDGARHLWTGTHDGTDVSIWVDGVRQSFINIGSITLASTNRLLTISGYCNASYSNWLGSIDEVRIYNRALSASEVAKLYQSRRGQDQRIIGRS